MLNNKDFKNNDIIKIQMGGFDCKNTGGLMQTTSTCWLDSVIMALLVPSDGHRLFSRFLKNYLGIELEALIDDITGFKRTQILREMRKLIIDVNEKARKNNERLRDEPIIMLDIPDNTFDVGNPYELLRLISYVFITNKKQDYDFSYVYNNTYYINSYNIIAGSHKLLNKIKYSKDITPSIPDDTISIKRNPLYFIYLLDTSSDNTPLKTDFTIKKNFESNGFTYKLQSNNL